MLNEDERKHEDKGARRRKKEGINVRKTDAAFAVLNV